jgi:hypothetical protein
VRDELACEKKRGAGCERGDVPYGARKHSAAEYSRQ